MVGVLASYSKQVRHKIDELSTVRDALDRIDSGEIRRSSAQNDRPSQRHFIADRLAPETIGKVVDRYRAGDLLTTLPPTTAFPATPSGVSSKPEA
jgi:hypothetical protein